MNQNGNSRHREKQRFAPDVHRMLPADTEAEQGVLSSLFLAPAKVMEEAHSMGTRPDWFHSPGYKTIFEEVQAMDAEGVPIDPITLTGRLRDKGLLDAIGGPAIVTALFTFLPTAANSRFYLETVQEKFFLREIIAGCTELAGRAYEEQDQLGEIRQRAEELFLSIADAGLMKQRKPVKTVVGEIIARMSAGKTEEAWGLKTGFPALDAVIRGLRAGNMFAIGGETGAGKTSLALNLVDKLCVGRGIKTMIFTLEMTAAEVLEVLLQIGTGQNIDAVAERRVSDSEIAKFAKHAEKVASAPLVVDDNKELSMLDVRSLARRERPRLIVIDYAQLLSGGKKKYERNDLEIADISRNAKKMAGELGATVLLLTQLNEEGKTEGSRRISKDADQVLIVEDQGEEERSILVCKQRRGKRQRVNFRWIGPCQKFVSKPLT